MAVVVHVVGGGDVVVVVVVVEVGRESGSEHEWSLACERDRLRASIPAS